MELRERIRQIEQRPVLPDGVAERFHGYAVIGLPFRSGHILGLRRIPASSIGPGYTSVWHRDPEGYWTFYTNVLPQFSCNRYWGSGVNAVRECSIEIAWTGASSFSIDVDGGALEWQANLQATPATRMMSGVCDHLPGQLRRQTPVLTAMGAVSGPMLRAGKISLHGHTCNGQEFEANPQQIWMIPESRAVVDGVDLGEVGPIPEQALLGDLWLPQRGVFMIGDVFMEQFDPARHQDRICTSASSVPTEHPG